MMLLGNINAIPFRRRFGRGGGSGDGFPQLPGDVTRWHFGGLTNEMMAAMDDPRIEDADHKGRFLSFKNFAWSGMSGAGGYNQNFNQWFAGFDESNKTVSDSSMKLVLLESDSQKVIYDKTAHQIGYTYNFYIKVTGIEGRTLNVKSGTLGNIIMSITEDGIYSINTTISDDWGNNRLYLIFPPSSSSNTVTIEQLPIYPGALVFDGVDDYGTCDNFPIPTKEKGYTVVALRQYLVEKSTAYLTANGDSIPNTSFIFEGNNYKDTWNFGKATGIQASRILATQTSKQYDGVKLNIGTNAEGSNLLQVGKWSKSYSNVAIWELVFLDHDATEEELTKIKDYFVKTYPWFFPDQAWTVTGKTNEDEDRATIANITGNGNNLVLSNFGFIEGSGYNEEGEYAGYLVTDGVDDKIQSKRFLLHRNWTMVGDWRFMPPEKHTNSGIVKSPAIRLYNQLNNITLYINRTTNPKTIPSRSIKAVCSDGRIYLDDWSEFLDTELQTDFESDATITIANYGVGFTKMVFKNLSFYDNQLLDKEDCIKAYNYLQTLKAK